MAALLSIQNLQIDFITNGLSTTAVQDISVDVQRGEIVAIVGESGSGKTVTALSILQLLPTPPAQYTKGAIWFTDKENRKTNLLQASHEAIRNIRGNEISMIFQEPMTSLNPVHTCGNQVTEAIILHQRMTTAQASQKTIELFETVQLPNPAHIYNRFPHQLSGGQKQRVMIAMAMSCNPSLIICDEPTTALDVTVQKTILQLIRNLQQQKNMGVIFISHDLGVVAEVADKVVVMFKGSIVEEGTVAALYKNPQHPYTKALLSCRPGLHEKGERLPVVSDFMEGNLTEKTTAPLHNFEAKNASSITINSTREPLLSVQQLQVWFPAKNNFFSRSTNFIKAVDEVSFDLYEGETVGLVGESGCGKSTLGRSILQLIKPTAGHVFFKGQDLAIIPANQLRLLRKDMQLIFQDPYSSLNPRMTIGQAIGEPIQVHALARNKYEKKEKVIELLEKVNLKAEHYNRYPHEFSGGQRQRIVIARALALHPAFIICLL